MLAGPLLKFVPIILAPAQILRWAHSLKIEAIDYFVTGTATLSIEFL